jgi:hypothetical protein
MNLQKQYLNLKQDYFKLRDSETLRKYRILAKAKKIGLKLFGRSYTIHQLSEDYEIPYTTVKRVLGLEKANKRTWELIKSKELSAFKAAMVLSTKDTLYQDEIIDMVLKRNLSTYQIKQIRVRDYKDLAKNDRKFAIAKGYSRDHEAYYKFLQAITRLNDFLGLKPHYLTDKNKELVRKRLEKLQSEIGKFVESLGGQNELQ